MMYNFKIVVLCDSGICDLQEAIAYSIKLYNREAPRLPTYSATYTEEMYHCVSLLSSSLLHKLFLRTVKSVFFSCERVILMHSKIYENKFDEKNKNLKNPKP